MLTSRLGFALICAVLVPRITAAEEAPPACETITTVRCSGAAAPLALPGRAETIPPPAAPAPPQQPAPTATPPLVPVIPPPPVPQADDAEVPISRCPCPPKHEYQPLQLRMGEGWRLVPQEHGGFAAERTVRKRYPGVWAPGLAIWLTTYFGGSILATAAGANEGGAIHWAPFWGAFGLGILSALDGQAASSVGYVTSALLQMGGFAMMIAGLAGSKSIQRMPVQVTPYGTSDGGGVSVGGRF